LSRDRATAIISAVIPTYNSRHIEACLKSILNQTEANLREIIVVDDASTDNTVEKVREVQSNDPTQRVALVRLGRNSGPSTAKNVGIQKASGALVACIDSDVVLEKDCIEKLVEDSRESSSIGTMAYFLVPREAGALTRVIGYDLEFRLSRILRERPWAAVGKLGTGATLFTKSSLLDAGLFDVNRRVGEDTALSYRLGELGGKLVISRRARCFHYWQSRGLGSYIRQQVGYGEGILQAYLDSRRIPRDPVSSPLLRLNALLAAGSLAMFFLSFLLTWLFWLSLIMFVAQIVLDLPAASWILARKRDVAAGLLTPLVLLTRNYSWAASLVSVSVKLLARRLRGSKSL
jgi:glycosyltransferase involved in cell wall biosynthesis